MLLVIQLALAHFVALASPGPDLALVLRISLARGRRDGIAATVGIMVGNATHCAASLLGLTALILAYPELRLGIQIIGGGYLGYLGAKGILSIWRQPSEPSKDGETASSRMKATGKEPSTWWRSVREGLLCNLLNAKAMLFFLGLFAVLLREDPPVSHIALLIGIMLTVEVIWFSLMATLATSTSALRPGSRLHRPVETVLAATLLILGAGFAGEALWTLVSG